MAHLTKTTSPFASLTAHPTSSPVLVLLTPVPSLPCSISAASWEAPSAASPSLGKESGVGGGGSEPSCGLGQQASAFQTLTAVDVFLLVRMQLAAFVCMRLYTHTHTHTYSPPHEYTTKIHIFPHPASFCKLQKYKRIKLSLLSLLSHQKLILHLPGSFPPPSPKPSPLRNPNSMILSVALYILLFIRNNIQPSPDSICRAAGSSAAERW